ncbi:MAG: ATP-dependent DNA helicase [Corynebacteriales bacterium]|nr:ATP-dependent DNA helicase [Mycobacteriales bacterium]
MPAPTVEDVLAAAVKAVPGGVERPGQLDMVRAVAQAIDKDEHLLVQAGTGTGKSLGYLVPALHAARRTVIATATLALQAQLVEHDLPRLVKSVTPVLGRKPTFALLKGRHNYACLAKLEAESDSLFDDGPQWVGEIGKLGKAIGHVREWALESDTGDRNDLDPGVEDAIWRHVSMPARECVGATRCPFGEECFAEAARVRAREADIIVTNHTLLAIDLAGDGQILPEHDLLIIDEAHELTSHVTNAAKANLSPESVTRVARTAKIAGMDVRDQLAETADGLAAVLDTITPRQLRPLPEPLKEMVTLVEGTARRAGNVLGSVSSEDPDVVEKNQAKQALRDLTETATRIAANADHDVVWSETDERGRSSVLVAPLSVSGLLATGLYAARTVVLTSATLALGGKFDQVAGSVGLTKEESGPSWRGLDVGSPFDYPKQGILYVASRLPKPGMSGLSEEAGKELLRLVESAGGRALGLFSSRKAAGQAAELLREATDLPVLLQGDDSLSNLVRQFKDEPASCLLGVMSLWQGVDVPGPSCQLVVIDRLPFPRPDDPLMAARARAADEAGSSGFMAVSVPHAAVRIAQGAGRLVRAADDKGVVAILDSRLHNARYGGFIRNTLPPFWYTTDGDIARAALSRLDG